MHCLCHMSKDKSWFQLTTLISVKSFRVDNKGLHCQENFIVLFVTELGRSKKIMVIYIHFPRGPKDRGKITLSRFNNYGY